MRCSVTVSPRRTSSPLSIILFRRRLLPLLAQTPRFRHAAVNFSSVQLPVLFFIVFAQEIILLVTSNRTAGAPYSGNQPNQKQA